MLKRALILLVCLAVCAMFLQGLPHGVEATVNPTAAGLAEFAVKAFREGWGYVYGTYGQVISQTVIDGKARQYPGNFNAVLSDGRTIYQTARQWIGRRAADCVGLVKAYLWWQGDLAGPGYNPAQDSSANGTFSAATIKGPISTIPETHGICLWRDGHMGVYIGNGWVIEARGTAYGVVRTRLSDRGWTHWFQNPHVSYEADGWTTIAGQTYYYSSGSYVTGIQNIGDGTYLFGSDGVLCETMALVSGHLRYFRADGLTLQGWQTLDGEQYYFDVEGYAITGWTEIDGKRCLFDSDGVLLTGWQQSAEGISYLGGDGSVRTGSQVIDGQTVWFDEAGRLMTGWQESASGKTHYDLSGRRATGLQLLDGKTWLFDADGQLLRGWQSSGSSTYYFDPVSGSALTAGLQTADGEERLFAADGSLIQTTGLVFADNGIFMADSDGRPQAGPAVLTGTTSSSEPQEISLILADGRVQMDSGAGFSLNPTHLVLQQNQIADPGALVLTGTLPEGSEPAAWLTLDPAIATVDANGLVTATGIGRTLVLLRTVQGDYAACAVSVLPDTAGPAPVMATLQLEPGESSRLAIPGLSAGLLALCTLSSSLPEIVTIDETGLITAHSAGQASILARIGDAPYAGLTVVVNEPLIGISARRTSLVLPVSAHATPFAAPVYLNSKVRLTFTSSNPAAAAVSADGSILALAPGTAVITASANDLNVTCSVTVIESYPTLHNGSTGVQVRNLQQRLADLGYLTGPVDGSFGPMTEFAVLCVQKKLGMALTGLADHQLQIALMDDAAPRAAAVQTAGTLSPGDSGESVEVLQQRLSDLGYLKGSVTGVFDELTLQAVRTLRTLNSLTAEDTVDPALTGRLLSHRTVAAIPALEAGQSGFEVRQLQDRLQALMYYSGPSDGNFNDDLVTAVRAFQFQNGLGIDGIAGPATQKAVYAANATICIPAALSAVTLTSLRSGMSGDAVWILETRLVRLGYHLGLADKVYDNLTASAISAFQKRCGLSQTGVADVKTQLRLFDQAAKTSLTICQFGSRGTSVTRIQNRLNQLGFICGSADGRFGSKTQNAVKNFQTAAGLYADGAAAWTTLSRLFSPQAPAAAAAVTQTPAGSPESVIDLETRLVSLGYLNAVADNTADSLTTGAVKAFQRRCGLSQTGVVNSTTRNRLFSASAPASTAVYKYGSRGTTVSSIQNRLNQLGFSCGRTDGRYGAKTRAAVTAFQKAAGLKATGTVNYQTAAALFAAAAPSAG